MGLFSRLNTGVRSGLGLAEKSSHTDLFHKHLLWKGRKDGLSSASTLQSLEGLVDQLVNRKSEEGTTGIGLGEAKSGQIQTQSTGPGVNPLNINGITFTQMLVPDNKKMIIYSKRVNEKNISLLGKLVDHTKDLAENTKIRGSQDTSIKSDLYTGLGQGTEGTGQGNVQDPETITDPDIETSWTDKLVHLAGTIMNAIFGFKIAKLAAPYLWSGAKGLLKMVFKRGYFTDIMIKAFEGVSKGFKWVTSLPGKIITKLGSFTKTVLWDLPKKGFGLLKNMLTGTGRVSGMLRGLPSRIASIWGNTSLLARGGLYGAIGAGTVWSVMKLMGFDTDQMIDMAPRAITAALNIAENWAGKSWKLLMDGEFFEFFKYQIDSNTKFYNWWYEAFEEAGARIYDNLFGTHQKETKKSICKNGIKAVKYQIKYLRNNGYKQKNIDSLLRSLHKYKNCDILLKLDPDDRTLVNLLQQNPDKGQDFLSDLNKKAKKTTDPKKIEQFDVLDRKVQIDQTAVDNSLISSGLTMTEAQKMAESNIKKTENVERTLDSSAKYLKWEIYAGLGAGMGPGQDPFGADFDPDFVTEFIDQDFIRVIDGIETRGVKNIPDKYLTKGKRSNAYGRYQFIPKTAKGLAPQIGYTYQPAPQGPLWTAKGQDLMFITFVKNNKRYLKSHGIKVGVWSLWLAHNLGCGSVKWMISPSSTTPSGKMLLFLNNQLGRSRSNLADARKAYIEKYNTIISNILGKAPELVDVKDNGKSGKSGSVPSTSVSSSSSGGKGMPDSSLGRDNPESRQGYLGDVGTVKGIGTVNISKYEGDIEFGSIDYKTVISLVGGAERDFPESWNGLDNNFRWRIILFANHYHKKTGKKLRIFSAHRSKELQTRLYIEGIRKHGKDVRKWVAKPGGSMHNYGRAVDIDKVQIKSIKNVDELLLSFKLHRRMSYEPWHVEPIETKKGNTSKIQPEKSQPKDMVSKDKVVPRSNNHTSPNTPAPSQQLAGVVKNVNHIGTVTNSLVDHANSVNIKINNLTNKNSNNTKGINLDATSIVTA